MQKILVICGPTATGKTSLALKLAEKFNGEIISADSRQVYKGLDIGTGKDIPKYFEKRGSKININGLEVSYYTDGKIKLWGYDLIEPDAEFSISDFNRISSVLIRDILYRRHLPIIVGGSGLYIKAITSDIETVDIPRNINLRNSLDGKDINELYEILAQNDPVKAASLNASDIKNKRRLMRAIEICLWKNGKTEFKKPVKSEKDYLFIGLIADKELSKSLVEKRVFERFYSGFQEEVERLIISGVSWDSQSMQSLGYRQIKDYFFGKNTKSEFLKNWVASELKYIKRQNTWFKKEKRIMWFNVKSPNLYTEVENTVIKWHNGEGLNI